MPLLHNRGLGGVPTRPELQLRGNCDLEEGRAWGLGLNRQLRVGQTDLRASRLRRLALRALLTQLRCRSAVVDKHHRRQ